MRLILALAALLCTVALRIVRNTDFRPVYAGFTNLPAHFLYVMAWMFQNFGGDLLPLPYTARPSPMY